MRCKRIRDQDTLWTQDDDSTMQRTQTPPLDEISLNRLEDCDSCDRRDGFDGCDGGSDEFYGYTRLRQPNYTLTGHVSEYGEQFGRSLGQHRVNTLGGHRVNTLGGHHVTTLGGAQINTLGGVRVNIGIIRMSSGQYRVYTLWGVTDCFSMDGNLLNDVSSVCSKRFWEQVNRWQSQPDRHTVWYLDSL